MAPQIICSEIDHITAGYLQKIRIYQSHLSNLSITDFDLLQTIKYVQSRRTNKPRDEMIWDENGRNPANNMAASIGTFQNGIKI